MHRLAETPPRDRARDLAAKMNAMMRFYSGAKDAEQKQPLRAMESEAKARSPR